MTAGLLRQQKKTPIPTSYHRRTKIAIFDDVVLQLYATFSVQNSPITTRKTTLAYDESLTDV